MKYDVIIIGGGIIGLTTAYTILKKHPKTKLLILEKEADAAQHQTGHNSGVIHSGIYYKPGSKKATTCREGIRLLKDFCTKRAIPYEICGKVIVATDETELPKLYDLYERGKANGIGGLSLIDVEQLEELEPHVSGIRAIHCPETGIVEYKQVAEALKNEIITLGGHIIFSSNVKDIQSDSKEITVLTNLEKYRCKNLINCGGLYTDKIAASSSAEPDMKIIPFRGEYYTLTLQSRYLVNNLIYPVPDPKFPFLGVHFTRRLNGEIEAGPNAVLAFAREGYHKTDINLPELMETLTYPAFWKMVKHYWKTGLGEMVRSFSKKAFVTALQKLIPEITSENLSPGGSGVRAQALSSAGKLLDDFHIIQNEHAIHVLNAPSPAATASFAIAKEIVQLYSSLI